MNKQEEVKKAVNDLVAIHGCSPPRNADADAKDTVKQYRAVEVAIGGNVNPAAQWHFSEDEAVESGKKTAKEGSTMRVQSQRVSKPKVTDMRDMALVSLVLTCTIL